VHEYDENWRCDVRWCEHVTCEMNATFDVALRQKTAAGSRRRVLENIDTIAYAIKTSAVLSAALAPTLAACASHPPEDT
jgi:hypothetical protein